jgi:hypothetical protein
MLDPDQIEAVINKKVSAQLRIGKYHNNLEKQETKTRVADEQSHPEIDRLSNEVNSDYKVKPKSSIRRLRKLEAQAEARVKKRIRLGTAQDVSNNKLVGSQHQEPMHFPGEEEIKDRRR